jgi:hypothetical protein
MPHKHAHVFEQAPNMARSSSSVRRRAAAHHPLGAVCRKPAAIRSDDPLSVASRQSMAWGLRTHSVVRSLRCDESRQCWRQRTPCYHVRSIISFRVFVVSLARAPELVRVVPQECTNHPRSAKDVFASTRLLALALPYQNDRSVGRNREPRGGRVDPTSFFGRVDGTAVADD